MPKKGLNVLLRLYACCASLSNKSSKVFLPSKTFIKLILPWQNEFYPKKLITNEFYIIENVNYPYKGKINYIYPYEMDFTPANRK